MQRPTKFEENAALLRQLEENLSDYLGIRSYTPPARNDGLSARAASSLMPLERGKQTDAAIGRLRSAVRTLKGDAAKLGAIPPHYPWHVDLVMRAVSALLPWYTRSLLQFGRSTTEAVEEIAEAMEKIVRTGSSAPGARPSESLRGEASIPKKDGQAACP